MNIEKEDLDKAMLEAMTSSIAAMNPAEIMKMMSGRMSFNVVFEDIPLKVDLKLKPGEILARIRVIEEQENGNQSETH